MAHNISTTNAIRQVMSKTPNKVWTSRTIRDEIFTMYGKDELLDTVRRVLCRLTNERQLDNGWIIKLDENEYTYREPSPTLDWAFGLGEESKPAPSLLEQISNAELIEELKRRFV